jgi:hypothetical protein
MTNVRLLLALTLLTSCASSPAHPVDETAIRQIVERDTFDTCHNKSEVVERKAAGCTYHPRFIDGQWEVLISRHYVDVAGKPADVAGMDVIYVYSATGSLINIVEH